MLSFALSIDDFIITLFNAGSETTFPLEIFGASQREISPQINVLASMILFASIGLMLIGVWWGRRRERAA
jgi:spermidine/putrescine transport system permease protein